MKNNWRKIVLISLCALLTNFLMAQAAIDKIKNGQYGTPQQRAHEMTQMMHQGLNLSAKQLPQVQALNLHYALRSEKEVVQRQLNYWSKYQKIMSMQKEKDVELKKVLSATQFQKYVQKRDELMWEGVKALF